MYCNQPSIIYRIQYGVQIRIKLRELGEIKAKKVKIAT